MQPGHGRDFNAKQCFRAGIKSLETIEFQNGFLLSQPGRFGVLIWVKRCALQVKFAGDRFNIPLPKVLWQEEMFCGFEVPTKQQEAHLAGRCTQCFCGIQQYVGESEILFTLFMIEQGRAVKSFLLTRTQDTHSGHGVTPFSCSENLRFRDELYHTPKGRCLPSNNSRFPCPETRIPLHFDKTHYKDRLPC